MKSRKLVPLLLIAFISAATNNGQNSVSKKAIESCETGIPVIEFCDLMADKERYLGKLIRTTAVAEYLISMEFVLYSKCGSKKPRISLGFKDDLENRTLVAITTEMNRQKKHSLTITATGVLQSAEEKKITGFGHYLWSKFQFEIQNSDDK
jgi:hypothetical protein